jgi:hypothetical protein
VGLTRRTKEKVTRRIGESVCREDLGAMLAMVDMISDRDRSQNRGVRYLKILQQGMKVNVSGDGTLACYPSPYSL